MAYVLGYFAADGSMISHKNGGNFIEFTSTDVVLLEHVQRATGSNHHITIRKPRNGKCKTAYRIQIGSKVWFEDLLGLGFTSNKSNTMKFPSAPDSFLGDFTRGYFDGDGCVYVGTLFAKDRGRERVVFQTQFISGSRAFLEALWVRLKVKTVRGGHIYNRNSGAANLVFSWKDSLALYQLMYHTGEAPALFLPRKRQKFQQAIDVLKLRP